MIKKAIGIAIAIAIGLGLILGIFFSGGIRITKANAPVATLQAAELDRVELSELKLNSKDTLELHNLLPLDRQLLSNLTNRSLGRNSLHRLEQLNALENTRAKDLLDATLTLNLS